MSRSGKDTKDSSKYPANRSAGKQFMTTVPKKGQTAGYFNKYEYVPEPYADTVLLEMRRKAREMEKKDGDNGRFKMGFMSSDTNRRGEFTHTMPTLRWKELLQKEHEISLQHTLRTEKMLKEQGYFDDQPTDCRDELEKLIDRVERNKQDPHLFQTKVPPLYDIGRTSAGQTPFCNKCSRDTFFCVHRVGNGSVNARRNGNLKTISMVIGSGNVMNVVKPQFGLKGGLRDFDDHSHLGSAFD